MNSYELKAKEIFVSIVMPAFNEEKYIETSLKSIKNLDYPKNLIEIIVVDNGSTDNTVEIAKKYADKVLIHPYVKVGAVRNYGVKSAMGDVIAFIDSDCLPAENWLKDSLDYMKNNSCDAVGGIYLLRPNPSWVESAWLLNPQPVNRVTDRLVGGAIIIYKDVFLQCGMFDENLNAGEDYALARVLKDKGYILHEVKSCALVHLGYPINLHSFMRRQFWHASSYLKSRKKDSLDILFIIVTIFLSGILLIPFLFVFFSSLAYVVLFIILLLPAVLSSKRILSSGYKSCSLVSYLKIYALDFCYLMGRSGGLVKSILTELKLISDKKVHY